jgi:hypothetical protein
MKIPLLLSILFLISLPLVSAFNGFGYGYLSPSQFLDNEWFVFGLIFIVMFAITFFALGRTMRENRGAVAVIAIAVALFISVAVSRRTYFYGYVGETIGSWLLILAILLGTIILIKFIIGVIGGIGLFLALGVGWFILKSIDPYDILPYQLLTSDFFSVYEFLAGSGFLFLLIIAFVIVLLLAYSGKKEEGKKRKEWWQNWLWGRKEPPSLSEKLDRIVGRN